MGRKDTATDRDGDVSRRYAPVGTRGGRECNIGDSVSPTEGASMNKASCLAVATLTLAACSSMSPMTAGVQGNSAPTVAVGGTQYCWKRNLVDSGGKLYCNWVADRGQVCSARDDKAVETARYSDPVPAGRCETGEYLVKVSPKA